MKLEITQPGVTGPEGPMPVGTVVEIEGDTVPGWLVNKAAPVGRVAVTNPAEGAIPGATGPEPSAQERQELLGEAAKLIDADGFLPDGRPDVRAINAELTDDAKPFTAAERDDLWPGIADAVKAARG